MFGCIRGTTNVVEMILLFAVSKSKSVSHANVILLQNPFERVQHLGQC